MDSTAKMEPAFLQTGCVIRTGIAPGVKTRIKTALLAMVLCALMGFAFRKIGCAIDFGIAPTMKLAVHVTGSNAGTENAFLNGRNVIATPTAVMLATKRTAHCPTARRDSSNVTAENALTMITCATVRQIAPTEVTRDSARAGVKKDSSNVTVEVVLAILPLVMVPGSALMVATNGTVDVVKDGLTAILDLAYPSTGNAISLWIVQMALMRPTAKTPIKRPHPHRN
jgi:hypothetical protein